MFGKAACSSAIVLLLALAGVPAHADEIAPPEAKTITFPSGDGLPVTADLYISHGKRAPFIVLFHQAGWSRGEYGEIAPRLAMMGFNVIAVDQRSGGKTRGVENETHKAAKKRGVKTDFVSALPDMKAALGYARKHHASGKLIAWGSSYSAALVIVLASDPNNHIDAVLSFAPGEYFARFGKSKTWIRKAAAKVRVPVFITSAKNEKKKWKAIYDALPEASKRSFLPSTKGNHGSRALWSRFKDSPAYWNAVRSFLQKVR